MNATWFFWFTRSPIKTIISSSRSLIRCGVQWKATQTLHPEDLSLLWLLLSNLYNFILKKNSKEIFESFLLPQRSEPNVSSEFEYMIFVWNGRTANPLVKASALSNAFELENLLNKGREHLLEILFSGGVIRNKKL
jgi:hypothetical protein